MLFRPTLIGARVCLRPLLAVDLDAYMLLLQDAESLRLTGTQRAISRADAARWLETLPDRDDRVDCAIILRAGHALIGEIVLNRIDFTNHSASLRIGLRTPYTNQGYGREAMQLLISYAFAQIRLHRIALTAFAFNPRAIHVAQQLGFQVEGRRREAIYQDGSYHDAVELAILEGEHRAWERAGRRR
jgi:RimJ/RimL family protein N-acetyltransferase